MHEVRRAQVAHFVDEGHEVHGVVHVGAHDGAECAWYVTNGHVPVIAFEPQPEPFADLQALYGGPHGVICVPVALGAEDGEMTLHVPEDGNTERSSRYTPIPTDGEAHAWTLIPPRASTTVPLRRFDSWVRETGIDLAPFDVLVVDAQGMELEVLRGMGDHLAGFTYLVVECSERPVYDGEAPAQEVVDWLAEQGFEPQTPVCVHDDIMFLRVREAP
jgi:FkbM family methyltransferase